MSRVAALIFDFDGLILDTETPEYESWREICAEHGVDLPVDEWVACIGSSFDMFNPLDYLEEHIGRAVDRDAIREGRRARQWELLGGADLLPGVRQWLEDARERELPCAVASSSPHRWVDRHLAEHGIEEYFTCVRCRDDVENVKPAPDLFLAAAECLGIAPADCLVLEDSPHGIDAAHAAGMRAIGAPNQLTARLDLNAAEIVAPSLGAVSLGEALSRLG